MGALRRPWVRAGVGTGGTEKAKGSGVRKGGRQAGRQGAAVLLHGALEDAMRSASTHPTIVTDATKTINQP